MEKEFQAGYYFHERTGVKENLYCVCYVPISIEKWFTKIKVSSEMNAILLQLYRKIGKLEGILTLMDLQEQESVNNLIDRQNMMCCIENENHIINPADYFDRMHEEYIQTEKEELGFFSELNHLRQAKRKKFIILNNTISILRREFNPTAPDRIGDCMSDLYGVVAEYKSDLKKQNEPLNPILFGGLLCYQLLTVSPYEKNNYLYSTYAVVKNMQEIKIFPEISIAFANFLYNNRNECEDRMTEVRQAVNINQWLLFYLSILDRAIEAENLFIVEQHSCMMKSLEKIEKVKNISSNMRNQMFQEMNRMHQMPVFRIEDVMKDFGITHSTATKMINVFEKIGIVRQMNDKQRYRIYEYLPLIECIKWL